MSYNTKLESLVISILYHNPHLIDMGLIHEIDFYNGEMRKNIEKLITLHKNGGIINDVTIGKSYPAPTPNDVASFEDYAISLRNLSIDRKINDLPRLITKIGTEAWDATFKLERIRELLDTCTLKKALNYDEFSSRTIVNEYVADLFNPDTTGIDIVTGIRELDFLLGGGYKNGEYILIGGDTGNCKSTLAHNIALFNALKGKTVVFFSLEMSKSEIMKIFISMLSHVNSILLRSQQVKDPSTKKFIQYDVVNIMSKLKLYIIDGTRTLDDIKLTCMNLNPDVVFVDYIQLMQNTDTTKGLELVSHEFKQMAMPNKINCPFIVLSQFSRPKDTESKENRDLFSLKGASALEQDADIAIFTKKVTNKLNIAIKKQRGGKNTTTDLGLKLFMSTHLIGDDDIMKRAEEYKPIELE